MVPRFCEAVFWTVSLIPFKFGTRRLNRTGRQEGWLHDAHRNDRGTVDLPILYGRGDSPGHNRVCERRQRDSQFLIFEWKDRQPNSAHGDWLKRNKAVFDHADYCTLSRSFRDVGPHSSGMGSGLFLLTSFLVLRDVDGYDSASRIFHDQLSGLDIEVSFEFPSAMHPSPWNKKGHPPEVFMSLSVHRGKDDPQAQIERSEVGF